MDKIFKALADINRRRIITLLNGEDMSVNQILSNFEIGQATVSNHLSILRKAKLVQYRIYGKQRIYSLNKDLLMAFAENMRKFAGNREKINFQEIEIRGQRV